VHANGIFVEHCNNVTIRGDEFMKGNAGETKAAENKLARDELVGKDVVVIGGQYKGHRGRVTFADDY